MDLQDIPATELKTDFQEGSIFVDELALTQYAQAFLASFIIFALSFKFFNFFLLSPGKLMMPKFQERYEQMDSKERAFLISCLSANLHHLCVVPMTLYGFTHSTCDGAYPFIWFFDEACYLRPEKFFVIFAMVSLAYLVNDYLIQFFIVKATDALAKQMHIHHIMGISGILFGLIGGYAIPGIACMTQITELSTILLNYRSMFKKEELGGPIPTFLQATFFLVYTVVRVFLMPYGCYVILHNLVETWSFLTVVRRVCVTLSAFMYITLTILNYYWYYLIVRRLLQVCGCIKKRGQSDKFEKVTEGYELD